MLLEAYYDIFGIINLDDDTVPMPLVWFTNADTVGDIGPMSEYILEYKINKVHDHFGLSLIEYLNLPITVSNSVLTLCKAENRFDKLVKDGVAANLDKQEKELDRMLKG